jgi:hypothetical protein
MTDRFAELAEIFIAIVDQEMKGEVVGGYLDTAEQMINGEIGVKDAKKATNKSNKILRQAHNLLRRAWEEHNNPLADGIRLHLLSMMAARGLKNPYDVALHRQRFAQLLYRYEAGQ